MDCCAGTPPRVWGLRHLASVGHVAVRYTPTRVGTSRHRLSPRPRSPVHPHACGDFLGRTPDYIDGYGTPPRVWGLPIAGCGAPPDGSVHPHACGDFAEGVVLGIVGIGTPPRVWGLRPVVVRRSRASRYTPTRVGTSHRARRTSVVVPVHPHACGDFGRRLQSRRSAVGTPPRVWGLRHTPETPFCIRRYTPTRVGTSEKDTDALATRGGTPPRVWGLHIVFVGQISLRTR